MSMISPEVQAQLDEQKQNCPFCKIIKGDIQSSKVYEDDIMEAVLDINPWIKGHTLLMPKEHYPIMPFLPEDIFIHIFGSMPKLIESLKKAMITTGANLFIANGAVAGQQSPHFLIHLLPRDTDDMIFNYAFNEQKEDFDENTFQLLKKNLSMMIANHLKRMPARWHDDIDKKPERLMDIHRVVYEDQKVLCAVPEFPQCKGHLVLYSKEENTFIEKLSSESSSHLFYCASYCATAVFEGLGAQGSNIILKTGTSTDNQNGFLEIHILPRNQDDGLNLVMPPMEKKPNSDEVNKKIKDEMFMLEYQQKEGKKVVEADFESINNPHINEIESAIDKFR